MSALGEKPAFLTHHIRNLRGDSQPILAEASDGLLHVVKFTNNLQGPNLQFNESMGTELYRLSNLPVPCWRPLLVTRKFLDKNPACRIETPYGNLRPAEGLCFGSRFLGSCNIRLLEIIPQSSMKRVGNLTDFWMAWLLDICAGHADNRQAIFRQENGLLDAIFLDHGHMFGGPKGDRRLPFEACRYLDRRIYADIPFKYVSDLRRIAVNLDTDKLWKVMQQLPAEWKTDSAVEKFAECLDALSKPYLIEGVLETIVDAHCTAIEINERRHRGNTAELVSRSTILARGTRQLLAV